ncbi:hypothetical protein NM04_13660 [Massilia aurea]|uniref:CHAT domain-containing protein n=2 Tax=Massilia aurea TaxID=373040 RepID=A0A422QK03_9BURK|nr:hypothetical protein NM04_13660 [Massilia aurea]
MEMFNVSRIKGMIKNESQVAVIEGKWEDGRNLSVKSLFDFVCDLRFESQHAFHYEMFNNGAAFQEILPRMCETANIRNIYIAAHGDRDGIYGSSGEAISFTRIKNAVKAINDTKGQLHSLYFGCCLFGQSQNMQELLEESEQLRWIAGYTKSISFVDSTVLDALFWQQYFNFPDSTPLSRIVSVYDRLKSDAPGLIKRLGFKVVVRDHRRTDQVYELV